MENEQKKEYLLRYRNQVLTIERIESEIEEIRSIKCSPTVKPNDGMPHEHGNSDLSGYAARIDELERELIKQREQLIKCFTELNRQIVLLDDEKEKYVLHFRYIKGLGWNEIADRMGYSERWIHKIHGRALYHFQIPTNNS